ncbi:sprT domain-containing protein [bacterium]|nr:sprT domain-containing protein [bacterium]
MAALSSTDAWLEKIPEAARPYTRQLLHSHPLRLTLAKNRNTRLGDYRPPGKDGRHRISVNATLNPYSFLLTLIHEYAHLLVHLSHGNRVAPHGTEWKQQFSTIMQPLLHETVYPEPLLSVLRLHMRNPDASSLTDRALVAALRAFDPVDQQTDWPLLSELPEGSRFRLSNGMEFCKGALRRSRIACVRLDNQRLYLVHPLVRVKAL